MLVLSWRWGLALADTRAGLPLLRHIDRSWRYIFSPSGSYSAEKRTSNPNWHTLDPVDAEYHMLRVINHTMYTQLQKLFLHLFCNGGDQSELHRDRGLWVLDKAVYILGAFCRVLQPIS